MVLCKDKKKTTAPDRIAKTLDVSNFWTQKCLYVYSVYVYREEIANSQKSGGFNLHVKQLSAEYVIIHHEFIKIVAEVDVNSLFHSKMFVCMLSVITNHV